MSEERMEAISELMDRIPPEEIHEAAHAIWLAARDVESIAARWLMVRLAGGMHFVAARRERREE